MPTHASVINVKIYEGYILLTLKKSKTLKQIKFYIVKWFGFINTKSSSPFRVKNGIPQTF
jgi:hypothetical protein